MNEEKIKTLQKQAIEAAKTVATKEIEKLKGSIIKQLNERREIVFDENVEGWAHKIALIVFSNELGVVQNQEEQTELNKAGNHAKSLLYIKLSEMIEELQICLGKKREATVLNK